MPVKQDVAVPQRSEDTKDQVALVEACRAFVAFKDELDATLTDADDPYDRYYEARSITPSTFSRLALPFSKPAYNYDLMAGTEVDAAWVISGSYQTFGRTSDKRAAEIMDLTAEIVAAGDATHPEAPKLARIGRLPLYVALEGKNRISLFRRYGRLMPAFVTNCPFPDPDAIRLIRYFPNGLGVMVGRDKAVLPYPEATLPLLDAYGVSSSQRAFSFGANRQARSIQRTIRSSMMMR